MHLKHYQQNAATSYSLIEQHHFDIILPYSYILCYKSRLTGNHLTAVWKQYFSAFECYFMRAAFRRLWRYDLRVVSSKKCV